MREAGLKAIREIKSQKAAGENNLILGAQAELISQVNCRHGARFNRVRGQNYTDLPLGCNLVLLYSLPVYFNHQSETANSTIIYL